MNEYLSSWPAIIGTVILTASLAVIFIGRNEIRQKIRSLTSLGGDKGAVWSPVPKGKVPDTDIETIHSEADGRRRDLERIDELEDRNEALSEYASQVTGELEEVRTELFLERVFSGLANWQYLLCKLAYEKEEKVSVEEVLAGLVAAYPSFQEEVSRQDFEETLASLAKLGLLEVIWPYTDATPLSLTETGRRFVQYVNGRM